MTTRSRLEEIHNPVFEFSMLETLGEEIAVLARDPSRFRDDPCPACGSVERALNHDLRGLQFQRCLQCRTVYVSPCPTEDAIIRFLRSSRAMSQWADEMPEETRLSRRKSLYTPRAEFIESTRGGCRGGIFVEIGGGGGDLAAVISERGLFDRIVVIEPQLAPRVIPSVEFHGKAFADFSLGETADCIVAFEVLEHIVEPDPFLRKIRDLLSPDGHFIFTTPNVDGFETATLGMRSHALWFDHVRLYNPISLRILLERNGFEAITLETPGELDVEIVHREFVADPGFFENDPDLRILMTRGYAWRRDVQDFLKSHLMSSHMRCVARPCS
jgi:SAM-dependent methyltransferase